MESVIREIDGEKVNDQSFEDYSEDNFFEESYEQSPAKGGKKDKSNLKSPINNYDEESIQFGSFEEDDLATMLSGNNRKMSKSTKVTESMASLTSNNRTPSPIEIEEDVSQIDQFDVQENYNDAEFEFETETGRKKRSLK